MRTFLFPLVRAWLVGVGLTLAACSTGPRVTADYLDRAVGRASQDEVRHDLGPPLMEVPGDDGATIWIYRYAGIQAAGPAAVEALWCYEHALTFGRDKRLLQWKRQDCYRSP